MSAGLDLGGNAAQIETGGVLCVSANLGLHQLSLRLGWFTSWFTPGYILPLLRSFLA